MWIKKIISKEDLSDLTRSKELDLIEYERNWHEKNLWKVCFSSDITPEVLILQWIYSSLEKKWATEVIKYLEDLINKIK